MARRPTKVSGLFADGPSVDAQTPTEPQTPHTKQSLRSRALGKLWRRADIHLGPANPATVQLWDMYYRSLLQDARRAGLMERNDDGKHG